MRTAIFNFLSIFITILLLFNAWMYFQQPLMIYFPMGKLQQTPADWGLDYEDVTLTTADNLELHGWYIPHKNATHTLLFFHGNAGNISHRQESIEIFHRLGLNVFIIDYRGYGNSQGRPSEQGLYRDALAAWDFLTNIKNISNRQILIFGRSLGGAVATDLAARVQSAGLIVESSFSSARDFARRVFPVLSHLLWVRFDFNTAAKIKQVKSPVLVLHSPDDEIMPFPLGEQVFQSASQPKQFIRMQGDHNSGFILSQPGYEMALKDWLTKI